MKKEIQYTIIYEGVSLPVTIRKKEGGNDEYHLLMDEIGEHTLMILDKIREDLYHICASLPMEQHTHIEHKQEVKKHIERLLSHYLGNDLTDDQMQFLSMYMILKTFSYGFIDLLLQDRHLEEIAINGGQRSIMVFHQDCGWIKTNLHYAVDEDIQRLVSKIALSNEKSCSELNPLLDAHLAEGHRVNATLSPISSQGTTITVRRFKDTPWNVIDLMKNGTINEELLALLWMGIELEQSIVVVGGTGSGKTSMLNALVEFISLDQRIISVEDTREIRLSKNTHWVPLASRDSNQEGKGEVGLLDLIVNALRMRPDRIIVGEIRRKEEAEVLFEAMRTGHSVYGTFHASEADDALKRLQYEPIGIPLQSIQSIGLMVVQHRNKITGQRRCVQIAEIDEKGKIRLCGSFHAKTKKFVLHQLPQRMLSIAERLYGMSKKEVQKNIAEKSNVLKKMKMGQSGSTNNSVAQYIMEYYQTKK